MSALKLLPKNLPLAGILPEIIDGIFQVADTRLTTRKMVKQCVNELAFTKRETDVIVSYLKEHAHNMNTATYSAIFEKLLDIIEITNQKIPYRIQEIRYYRNF